MKHCELCGKPMIRHGRAKYCDALCGYDARGIRSCIRQNRNEGISLLIQLLLERGDKGAKFTGLNYTKMCQWNWIVTDDDGYSRLNEHGKQAVQRLLEAA